MIVTGRPRGFPNLDATDFCRIHVEWVDFSAPVLEQKFLPPTQVLLGIGSPVAQRLVALGGEKGLINWPNVLQELAMWEQHEDLLSTEPEEINRFPHHREPRVFDRLSWVCKAVLRSRRLSHSQCGLEERKPVLQMFTSAEVRAELRGLVHGPVGALEHERIVDILASLERS